jgi:hypothetical protein
LISHAALRTGLSTSDATEKLDKFASTSAMRFSFFTILTADRRKFCKPANALVERTTTVASSSARSKADQPPRITSRTPSVSVSGGCNTTVCPSESALVICPSSSMITLLHVIGYAT